MLVIHFSLSPSQFGLHSASMQQTKSYILSSASHVGLTFCGKAQTDVSIDLGHTVPRKTKMCLTPIPVVTTSSLSFLGGFLVDNSESINEVSVKVDIFYRINH